MRRDWDYCSAAVEKPPVRFYVAAPVGKTQVTSRSRKRIQRTYTALRPLQNWFVESLVVAELLDFDEVFCQALSGFAPGTSQVPEP